MKNVNTPPVQFTTWRHKETNNELIGYFCCGDPSILNAVLNYFGRGDLQHAYPSETWVMLNPKSGALYFCNAEEIEKDYTPATDTQITLSPIKDFEKYSSSDEVVEAIQIPLLGGIRRFMGLTNIDLTLRLSPSDVYVSVQTNVLRKSEPPQIVALPGDWIVKHADGSFSACTHEIFEETYKYIDMESADFSDALMWLKEGKRVARKGWNAGGQFCWMVPEGQYPARMEAIKGYFPTDTVPYGAYFALKNAQDVVVPWVPSVGDLLATDWIVIA